MEYVVPLIILLVVVIAVVVGARLLGRRTNSLRNPTQDGGVAGGSGKESGRTVGKTAGKGSRREITREDAQDASARLSPEQHRTVYSLIAQHQVLSAVREYRKATRLGLGEAAAAVAALAQFPQPTPEPNIAAGAATRPAEPKLPAADAPLTVEDIINAGAPAEGSSAEAPATRNPARKGTTPEAASEEGPEAGPADSPAPESLVPESPAPEIAAAPRSTPVAAHGTYRYRAIVSKGGDIREVASTRLNEQVFSNIKNLARAGDHDGAARLLREHADIGTAEAHEFVAMIGPED